MIIFGKDLMDNVKNVIPRELDSLSDDIEGLTYELEGYIETDDDYAKECIAELIQCAKDIYEISDMLKTQTTPRIVTRDKRKIKKGA
jgi:hypothetical protein